MHLTSSYNSEMLSRTSQPLMGFHHDFGKISQWNGIQISYFVHLYTNYSNSKNKFSPRNIRVCILKA